MSFPIFISSTGPREAGDGDDNARYRNAKQRKELQKHEDVRRSRSEFRGYAVEKCDDDQATQRDAFVDPVADMGCFGTDDGANKVFAEYDGDNSGAAGLENESRSPREEEASPLAKDLG